MYLSSELGIHDLKIETCYRLERRGDLQNTPCMSNKKITLSIYRHPYPTVEDLLGYRTISITLDMTLKEQEIDLQLRTELKR